MGIWYIFYKLWEAREKIEGGPGNRMKKGPGEEGRWRRVHISRMKPEGVSHVTGHMSAIVKWRCQLQTRVSLKLPIIAVSLKLWPPPINASWLVVVDLSPHLFPLQPPTLSHARSCTLPPIFPNIKIQDLVKRMIVFFFLWYVLNK